MNQPSSAIAVNSEGDSNYPGTLYIGITISLSVLLMVISPVSSFARPLTSLELIAKAYKRGEIDYRASLNYKVMALLKPEALPSSYKSRLPVKSGTPILIEARAKRHLLSHENARLLAREREGTIAELYGADITVLSHVSPEKRFRIHYTTDAISDDAVPAADSNGNSTPDYVERLADILDHVWETEINRMGYNTPPSDGDLGGDCLLDVYLADLGAYGYTQIDENQPVSTVYMILDNDFYGFPDNLNRGGSEEGSMKVAAAHEFFHTIQFQITEDLLSNGWWMEASATWIEDYVYPEVDDYVTYLYNWFQFPEIPLNCYYDCNDTEGIFPYGTAIWVRHMTEKFGSLFVYEVWGRIKNGEPALSAIENELTERGSNLAGEIKELRVANLTYTYDDGYIYQIWHNINPDTYPIFIKYTPHVFTQQEIFPVEETLLPLSSKYYFLYAPAGEGSLDISFTGDGNTSVVVVGDRSTASPAGYDVTEVLPDANNNGSISINGFSSDGPYKRIVVILINHSSGLGTINLSASYSTAIPPAANSIEIIPANSSITVEDAGYGKMGKQQYFIIMKNTDANKQILENGVAWASSSSLITIDGSGFATASNEVTGALINASLGSSAATAAISSNNQPLMPPGADRGCDEASIVKDVTTIVNKDTGNSDNSNDKRCFIATAAFGSPLHPYVNILRDFRDRYLLTNLIGRNLVSLYYNYSPQAADVISKNAALKGMVKIFLIPAIISAWFMIKTTLLEKIIIISLLAITLIIVKTIVLKRYKTIVRQET